MTVMRKNALRLVAVLALIPAAGCTAVDRIANVGKAPTLSPIENPTEQAGYKPVRIPMPEPVAIVNAPNSLWRVGARAFFKDQRARQVGDILTVTVKIDDKAELANKTSRSRSNSEDVGLDSIAGYETKLDKIFPNPVNAGSLIDADSKSSSNGEGSIDREEEIETTVGAIVTQVLPNGNLVIEGRQEVRVNYEVRELIVAGIVRPEDIAANNTIDSDKIAQARIAYGGRGQISDIQQPRYGQQVLDILLPF